MSRNELLGFVNFDSGSTNSNEVEIMIPHSRMHDIRRGQYVRIESKFEGKTRDFFARISMGPFFHPDAVSRDSAFARASVLHADSVRFKPDYHGICSAQVIGELDVDKMRSRGTFVRPSPQASVYALTAPQIEKLLELSGDMYLGQLSGYPSVRVSLPSDKNAALPRNVGIFGTVGSGKTNTSQVLIEEAASHHWAVVVLDVEGEYVNMDKPSRQNLPFKRFGVEARGVTALKVYHPVGTEPAVSRKSEEFSIRFSSLEPHILAEIMGLNDVQNEGFQDIWHTVVRRTSRSRQSTNAALARSLQDPDAAETDITLREMAEEIRDMLENHKTARMPAKSTLRVLARKFRMLQRYEIFDGDADMGNYAELLQSNLASIIDLSGSSNDVINNIVVMDVLRNIFALKLKDRNRELPNVLIVIEEAHTLVSKDKASQMEETLDVLREISRRGRKRWLSLCFISQQPSHLPPEIYELCNTKIVHQTSGGNNLNAIKNSSGGADASVWNDVPLLGQGTCLFISSYFKNRPMFVDVRPCQSERRHVEEE